MYGMSCKYPSTNWNFTVANPHIQHPSLENPLTQQTEGISCGFCVLGASSGRSSHHENFSVLPVEPGLTFLESNPCLPSCRRARHDPTRSWLQSAVAGAAHDALCCDIHDWLKQKSCSGISQMHSTDSHCCCLQTQPGKMDQVLDSSAAKRKKNSKEVVMAKIVDDWAVPTSFPSRLCLQNKRGLLPAFGDCPSAHSLHNSKLCPMNVRSQWLGHSMLATTQWELAQGILHHSCPQNMTICLTWEIMGSKQLNRIFWWATSATEKESHQLI